MMMRNVLHLCSLMLPVAHAFGPAVTSLRPGRGSLRAAVEPQMGRTYLPGDRVLLIDGTNLMAHRKVTKGREEMAAKLAGIRGARCVLVFDGRRGEATSTSGNDPQVVVTEGGDEEGNDRVTADDWIEQAIQDVPETRIEVVTADRGLREIAHSAKAKTINPAKFWRRYLPRLKGLKNDYKNEPKID